jgi:ABC-2 type transport system ATP-binding protein
MDKCVLKIDELCKSYKDFALKEISFSLEEGYILGIIGRNGAGKTTLMNCILGKTAYDKGSIQIGNSPQQFHSNLAKENLGFVVEPGPFFVAETLWRNGELLGPFYKTWNQKAFYHYLREFELHPDKLFCDLSKGMKTKFQLAFALAHSPKLLVLDEPTGGLDPVFRQEFLRIMQHEVRENLMSVIISTHLTTDLDKVADYVMLLDKGECVFYLNKEEMMDSYPLVSGTTEQLTLFDSKECGRIRKKHGTFTTMFKNPEYLKAHPRLREELQVERTNIEEMMYYLSEGEL